MTEQGTIGERVRRIRKDMGLNQNEMGAALGLSLRGFQSIERNENIPSGESLLGFARIGISPTYVLTGEGPVRLDDKEERNSGVDAAIFTKVDGEVRTILIQAKRMAPERTIVEETVQFYNELVKLVTDLKNPALVDAGLMIVGSKFKDRVNSTEYGTGKRSA